jgi:hypothetical protein
MCLNKGAKPTLSEFRDLVHRRNLDNLSIWHNVGLDIEQGAWAIAGARQGTFMTMLTDWDYRNVQSFDALEEIWKSVQETDPADIIVRYEDRLKTQLDLAMNVFAPAQSQFFKKHYQRNWHNQGVMTREIDIIRRQEGW